MSARWAGSVLAAAWSVSTACGDIFQPDSATTGSQFSGSYVIANSINGSGLPGSFTIFAPHATYAAGNHWTTAAGALQAGNAWASYQFNRPVTIGTFHLWNHRSNGVAADPGYAVTLFDLRFFDERGNLLFEMLGESAVPNVQVAQSFCFEPVDGVKKVDFKILANNGSPNYTGVAEVAFDSVGRDTSSGDLNCDLLVNGADLAILLGSWGPCSEGCPKTLCNADVNGDCVIDAADLAVLLGGWTG